MNRHFHRLVFNRARGVCMAVAETVAAAGKPGSGERGARVARRAGTAALALSALAAQGGGLPGGSALGGVAPMPVAAPSVTAAKPTLPAAGAALLPSGATVVKGAGTISVSSGDMTVNQSTARLVTDWQSFSIGAGNSVRFEMSSFLYA